jgi:hypothetical protein
MMGVVVPTRGRPDNARRLVARIEALSGRHDRPAVVLCTDFDDLHIREYDNVAAVGRVKHLPYDHGAMAPSNRKGASTFVRNVNRGAAWLDRTFGSLLTSITVIGDDHLPQRAGWLATLDEYAGDWGMAYPNDGHQGEALPTCVTFGIELYRALGFICPPRAMQHLYTDNYWYALGVGLQALTYCAQVEVTHLHPHAGLAPTDAQYDRVYGTHRRTWDEREWVRYREEPLRADIERVQTAKAARS